MQLIPLNQTKWKDWDDLILPLDGRSLFHNSVWLKFLKRSQNGNIILLELKDGNQTVGYFPGMIIKKGPFKILGSPLIGWTTQIMGPILDPHVKIPDFIRALENYCKDTGIDQLEFASPLLKPGIMQEFDFKYIKNITPVIELGPDEKSMWLNLKAKSCRYMINKAVKNGVVVENTNDPMIVDQYYDQLIRVFARQGLAPTYPRNRVRTLFESLKKKDMLFCLQAKFDERVIATGLFPHDDQWVYYWGGASDYDYMSVCPNELVQWTLMKMAFQKGIKKYDLYGGDNHFKLKFGAQLVDAHYWFKSYTPLADLGRSVFGYHFSLKQKIVGRIRKGFNPKKSRFIIRPCPCK